jgi:hypothetical protein
LATTPSSTPIAPEGMGPRSVLLLLLLLLGFGAFYWLSHDPNVLDAFSDLKAKFEPPAPPAPPAAPEVEPSVPSVAPVAPNPGDATVIPPAKREQERIQKLIDEQIAKMEKKLAEEKGQVEAEAMEGGSRLMFVAEPDCAPIGRQWRVSGTVFNTSNKRAPAQKATITLLIDGEPAEEQTVEIGPFEPLKFQGYEVLIRPSRGTFNHTVTATASWER